MVVSHPQTRSAFPDCSGVTTRSLHPDVSTGMTRSSLLGCFWVVARSLTLASLPLIGSLQRLGLLTPYSFRPRTISEVPRVQLVLMSQHPECIGFADRKINGLSPGLPEMGK